MSISCEAKMAMFTCNDFNWNEAP